MIIDQLLLVVLLAVTLALLYMLYRFYSLVQKKGKPPIVEKQENPEPSADDSKAV